MLIFFKYLQMNKTDFEFDFIGSKVCFLKVVLGKSNSENDSKSFKNYLKMMQRPYLQNYQELYSEVALRTFAYIFLRFLIFFKFLHFLIV